MQPPYPTCDLKSHFVSDSRKGILVSVQTNRQSHMRCWQRQGMKLGQKPNGKGSHHRTQGKTKIGRVNDCESSLEASSSQTTETMDETVVLGQCEKGNPYAPVRTPQAPAYRRHLPRSCLTNAEQGNPVEVWLSGQ